jgi:ribonuclease P protein component
MQHIRQRADFLAAAGGAKANATAFVLQARKRDDNGPARIGFTVTRKVGTATERNRVRRRLREMVRLTAAEAGMRTACDYVVIGRRSALTREFSALREDLHQAMRRVERDLAKTTVPGQDR